ncbi:Protein of unknown function DUF2034 [Cordyceps militaris]|uniref:Uncharacterized protein n=1 Tax=Cordyceps militaris TaxID=73501 RepID=A0A2H4SAB2_CORMI|nr:Protein of unknown function DUF2034 [Cordyceps militaris]
MYCLHNPSARRQFLALATGKRRSLTTSARRASDNTSSAPAALIYPAPSSRRHHDLASFQSYAARTKLDPTSTVYVGTLYEYTVAAALARHGFSLRRVGGARDRGTDLLGTWTLLPGAGTTTPVLVQCKAGVGQRVGPQHVRELEGALAGAPPGWRAGLAVLACERPATRGVREALARSRWPMALVCCEAAAGGGRVRQMVWNKRAEEQEGGAGLQGVAVGTRFDKEGEMEMVLLHKGRVLPFVGDGGCGDAERGG